MGPLYHQRRIPHTVQRTTPTGKVPSSLPGYQPYTSEVGPGRDRQISGKASSGKGDECKISGILQSHISGPQEERILETSNRSITAEQVYPAGQFPDGNDQHDTRGGQDRRLGSVSRPVRCLPSRSHSPSVTQISAIRLQGTGIAVSGTPFRDLDSPSGVYVAHENSSGPSQIERAVSASVLRRLATAPSQTSTSIRPPVVSLDTDGSTGADAQSREIRTDPLTSFHVRGDAFLFGTGHGESSADTYRRYHQPCPLGIVPSKYISKTVPVVTGNAQCGSRPSAPRSSSCTSTTDSVTVSMATAAGSVTRCDRHYGCDTGSPEMVATRATLFDGCSHPQPGTRSVSLHRCKFSGLGGTPRTAGTNGQRDLESSAVVAPYQQLRVVGGIPCTAGITSRSPPYVCHGVYGQHHCCCLHQATRWDSFSQSLQRDGEITNVVPGTGHSASGETYTRQVQHSGRPFIPTGQATSDRVGTGPGNSEHDMFDVRSPDNRSVCDPNQSQTSPIRVTSPRSSSLGGGCNVIQLESYARVRIPTDQNDSSGVTQNPVIPVPDNPGSPTVAPDVMVSGPLDPTVRLPEEPPQVPDPADSSPSTISSLQPRRPSTSRLAIIRRRIRERQFSAKVASLIAESRRPSTRKVYQAKWKVFCDWCSTRQIDPVNPSVTDVANFFVFLFETKNCAISTIKGYRSALSNTLKFGQGTDIGSNLYLSELMRSFELRRPVTRSLTPKWNLSCVLWSLCKPPYEPLSQASLMLLTCKTVFLLAFATARRRSEIHAFSVEPSCLRFNKRDGSVSLLCQMGFLAKNQLPSVAPEVITVPSLANACGPRDADRLLCPVRALKFYLKRVAPLRGGRKRLFIPVQGSADISASTISRWITNTIKRAYEALTERDLSFMHIKAHEVRALSTSWAFINHTPLHDVMNAAVWRSETTFSSFYLRSLASQTDELFSLGPTVAAQRVIREK